MPSRQGSTPVSSPLGPLAEPEAHFEGDCPKTETPTRPARRVSSCSAETTLPPTTASSTVLPQCDGCDAGFSPTGSAPHLLACGHTLCHRCLRRCTDEHTAVVRCPPPPRGCAAVSAVATARVNYAIHDVTCPFVLTSQGQPEGDAQHLVLDLAVEMHIVCTICLEAYSEEHMPFALPCGHTFCHRCLARLRAGDLFQCPNRCPLPDEVEVEDPEMVLLPVPNFALLRAVNNLRVMHGVPPINPGPDIRQLLAKAADEDGLALGDASGGHSVPSYSVRLGARRRGPSRAFVVGMLLYTMFAASSSAVVALTQGPDCSRMRRWLAGLAALFVAVPTSTVMLKRFPSRLCKVIRLGMGLIFYCWVVCGIPWSWVAGDVCQLLSITWLLGSLLLCLHLTFGALQLGRELLRLLGHCQRGCAWVSHLAPFMDVF